MTSINDNLFWACTALESVVIPETITEIGNCAFIYCRVLNEITSKNPTPPTISSSTFSEVPVTTCTLKVPTEAVEAYKAAEYWKDFLNIVGFETATTIDAVTTFKTDTPAFNLQGQPVSEGYKGIVIQNGKKMLRK